VICSHLVQRSDAQVILGELLELRQQFLHHATPLSSAQIASIDSLNDSDAVRVADSLFSRAAVSRAPRLPRIVHSEPRPVRSGRLLEGESKRDPLVSARSRNSSKPLLLWRTDQWSSDSWRLSQ
jgi:hypothetical protein